MQVKCALKIFKLPLELVILGVPLWPKYKYCPIKWKTENLATIKVGGFDFYVFLYLFTQLTYLCLICLFQFPQILIFVCPFQFLLMCSLHICWMTIHFFSLVAATIYSLFSNKWQYLFLWLIAIYVCLLWVMQRPERIHVGCWWAAWPLLLSGGGQVEKTEKGNSSDTLWTLKETENQEQERENQWNTLHDFVHCCCPCWQYFYKLINTNDFVTCSTPQQEVIPGPIVQLPN